MATLMLFSYSYAMFLCVVLKQELVCHNIPPPHRVLSLEVVQ